jgi:hypothetical protein
MAKESRRDWDWFYLDSVQPRDISTLVKSQFFKFTLLSLGHSASSETFLTTLPRTLTMFCSLSSLSSSIMSWPFLVQLFRYCILVSSPTIGILHQQTGCSGPPIPKPIGATICFLNMLVLVMIPIRYLFTDYGKTTNFVPYHYSCSFGDLDIHANR